MIFFHGVFHLTRHWGFILAPVVWVRQLQTAGMRLPRTIYYIFLALLAAAGCKKRAEPQTVRSTALNSISIEHYASIPKPASDGGGFASDGETVLLATGDGVFYDLRDGLRRLDIPPPFDRKGFLEDWKGASPPPRLRLTGALLSGNRLYVAHQHWRREDRCFTMAVSVTSRSAPKGWRKLFETSPCLSFEDPFDDSETGGRLALAPDGDLLLTVGDHGFSGLDGSDPFAQAPNGYGKIHKISSDGAASEVLSIGHRNPQGLTVDSGGRIWASEHGPQGGDELNLIEAGQNYGWPLVTYGTSYGSTSWPLNPKGRSHGSFREPAMAFVPAIAASAVIEVDGIAFPEWRGDLLIGSLRTMALFRVRLAADRAVYVEPIPLGERVRDVVQTPEGSILIWADRGVLLQIARAATDTAYERYCSGCHEPAFGAAAGPDLRGVIGSEIASHKNFPYSAALTGKKGRWTKENLNAFLTDPEQFAPGTTMRLPALDDETRAEILEFLNSR